MAKMMHLRRKWLVAVLSLLSVFVTLHYRQRPPPITIPDVHVNASCEKLFRGDSAELGKAKLYQREHAEASGKYPVKIKDCLIFKRKRKYISRSIGKEEDEFPIAFSIVMFKDVEQVERLLRAIYRPQNYYCIHVDLQAAESVKMAMKQISSCFDNVFVPNRTVNIRWGTYSVLEADLICMRELLAYKKWRYFINLTGQEFPLRTNAELVKILKIFNGANSMEATRKRRNLKRFRYVHDGWKFTNTTKAPPPYGIIPTKGSVHITVSRAFVEYVIHDEVAKDFLAWLKDTHIPDEGFFSSLNHNPHLKVPGSYKGEPETDPKKYPFVTRFKNWGGYPFNYNCSSGRRVRGVCIFGAADLPLLKSRPELFANKFYLEWEPLALDCMEELYFNKTRTDYAGQSEFNDSFYRLMPFISNHI